MSDAALRRAISLLALLGAGIAGYLSYVHYAGIAAVCSIGGGCEQVQSSRYAELAGVPVALLGLLSYLAILLLVRIRDSEACRLALLGVTMVGFGFSGYLTYREIWTIKAICPWCAASAILMTLLLVLATTRFLRPVH
ncbi:MAG: hypothetical protein NVSMB51_10340 [Solirubrobacteraceae bacterium]